MPLETLISNNADWAKKKVSDDENYFKDMADDQRPEYLWIGCSDSRVPANEVVGLPPGELFVHRNIANLVIHTDYNSMSVIQYAIEVLKVKHVIVCGHYGCGGVRASIGNEEAGFVDGWLRHIRDIYYSHVSELDKLTEDERVNRLCELNVVAQVLNLVKTKVAQHAWDRGQSLAIHGWIYNMKDGLIKDLKVTHKSREHLHKAYHLFETTRATRPDVMRGQSE